MPKSLVFILIGLALVGFLGLMAAGLSNKSPHTSRSGVTRVDKPAPEIRMPLFDGGELVLSEYRGQPIVINFWASWCPPCRVESPALERTWQLYSDRDVLFVGVDIQDTENEGRAYVEEFDLTYPNGTDGDGKITVDYGVIGLPVTFFVNRDGIVERRWVGAVTEEQLVTWVDELVAGVALSSPGDRDGGEEFIEFD